MQYDYYAFRKEQLGDPLNELEHTSDKTARKRVAEKTFKINEQDKEEQIEPHLPYLWYEAQDHDLKNSIRDAWQKLTTDKDSKLAKQIQSLKEEKDKFQFVPELSALNFLPSLSFMLRVPFKLQKPYLSKDDRTFHLLDNPVRKDKVFQTPMVAATSWKGALRTFWQLGHQEDNEQIIRLFGNAREDEKGQAGRLYFYPTFFDKLGLEVINPHDRKKGTGKNPILLECVPANAIGEFIVLYVPFGSITPDEVGEDLKRVVEGVEKMLTVYGFGAKTSSGFGIADVDGKGELAIRADIPALQQPEPKVTLPEPELPRYLIAPGQLHPEFKNSDGSLKSEAEYLQGKSGKKAKQLYQKAKDWWEREGCQLAQTLVPESAPEPEPQPPKLSMTEVSFASFGELGDRVQEMAEHLCNGGQA